MLQVTVMYHFFPASFSILTTTPLPSAFELGPPPLSHVGHIIKFDRGKSLDFLFDMT